MRRVSKYLAIALIAGLFGVAVTVAGERAEPKEGIAQWEYPGAKRLSAWRGGPLQTALYVTSDDLAKVLKHYGEKLGHDLPVDVAATGGNLKAETDRQTASFNDSFQPFDEKAKKYPPRPVAMHVAVQNTKAYTVTLVISRVDGEKHTHIALTYVSR